MKYSILITLIVAFLIVLSFMAFQTVEKEDPVIQTMIEEEVARRMAEYRRVRILKCQERILKIADIKADSIIFALARDDFRIDSIPRPQVPERPERPEIKPPKDTTPVAPLLPVDSIEFDW